MNYFYKESKSKIGGRGESGEVLGGGRWTDRQTCPNQFAPSTSSKLGA